VIRYLIWDADGALFNTYPAITDAMHQALKALGGQAPRERVARLCKVSFGHCIGTLSEEQGVDPDAYRAKFNAIYATIPLTAQPPFPRARALCTYICKIGGANFILTHRGRDSLEKLLHLHNLEMLITDAVTADDDFPRKPDPAGLNALIARHHIPREAALLIGDRELDILAAHAADVRACFFGDNPHDEPADFEVTDFATLLHIIQEENDSASPLRR
jgi:phosphoglycolate phosphatase-like HAD superfamily hydrolase